MGRERPGRPGLRISRTSIVSFDTCPLGIVLSGKELAGLKGEALRRGLPGDSRYRRCEFGTDAISTPFAVAGHVHGGGNAVSGHFNCTRGTVWRRQET